MFKCWGCGRELTEDDFYKDKGKKSGRQSKCKRCQTEQYQKRFEADPARVRAIGAASQRKHRRRRLYGITDADFAEMVEKQFGRCAICHQIPPPREGTRGGLVIDHCHDTQRVRGLLCHNCNRAIGLLQDDPRVMIRAAEYLGVETRVLELVTARPTRVIQILDSARRSPRRTDQRKRRAEP